MTLRRDETDNGSWSYAEALYDRGNLLFVAELRRITDADRLGNFAARWYGAGRTAPQPMLFAYLDHPLNPRQLLLAYLDQPLNAFRHEALVKRLFKLAEAAGDDEVMGRFLVAFDRSLRRVLKKRRLSVYQVVETRAEAEALVEQWRDAGYQAHYWANWGRNAEGRYVEQGYRAYRTWLADVPRVPDKTTMPRTTSFTYRGRNPRTGERMRLEKKQTPQERLRLFSLATRRYLRRRAWR